MKQNIRPSCNVQVNTQIHVFNKPIEWNRVSIMAIYIYTMTKLNHNIVSNELKKN
jgi:hypothetical protein